MAEEHGTASTTEPRELPAFEREESTHITPAQGSGELPREAIRAADAEEMATREMHPDQFRALLASESTRTRNARSPTIPATSAVMQELVARSAAPLGDDDLAIPVEARTQPALVVEDVPRPAREPREPDLHAPYEPLALTELDPRRATRHAAPDKPATRRPTPASGTRLTVLLVVLMLSIGGAVAFYVLTGRLV